MSDRELISNLVVELDHLLEGDIDYWLGDNETLSQEGIWYLESIANEFLREAKELTPSLEVPQQTPKTSILGNIQSLRPKNKGRL